MLTCACLVLTACASSTPELPYPAFIQADELPDIFMAGLPGIRAKRFAGNSETRRSSNMLTLPADWSFTTGGLPDKSVEIYVLAGTVTLGEFALQPGSYAYVPDGSTGVPMRTESGAQILYFLDDANPASVIQTPIISSRDILPWQNLSDDPNDFALSIKELRADPGSGARTWLLRIDPGASLPWQSLSVVEEGFMVEGNYQHSECVDGEVATAIYTRGGYYHRPPGSVNAGPESNAIETSVWFIRIQSDGEITKHDSCLPAPVS